MNWFDWINELFTDFSDVPIEALDAGLMRTLERRVST